MTPTKNTVTLTLRLPVLTDVVVTGRAIIIDEDDGVRLWAIRDAGTGLEVDWEDDDTDDLINGDENLASIDAACEKALEDGTIKAEGEEGEEWKSA